MEEKILMRLEVIRGETLATLNQHFRFKVQLEEQMEENEVKIHYHRGVMDGLERIQNEIADISKGTKIAEMKAKRLQMNDRPERVVEESPQ